ncbi:hypothetical protein MP638_000300 [Amoeboaphelidium occidentale]|nr:hypothetical protein MP638_000300 [Amoeboaphelidium occidentale]
MSKLFKDIVTNRSRQESSPPPVILPEGPKEKKNVGICFSGGGIKSASFSCGILMALAGLKPPEKPKDPNYANYKDLIPEPETMTHLEQYTALHLLSQLDFLSAVSGGAYSATAYISFLRHFRDNFSEARKIAYEFADIFVYLDRKFKNKMRGVDALRDTTEDPRTSPTRDKFDSKEESRAATMVATAAVHALYQKMHKNCGYVVDRSGSTLRMIYTALRLIWIFMFAEIVTLIPVFAYMFLGASVAVNLFGDLLSDAMGTTRLFSVDNKTIEFDAKPVDAASDGTGVFATLSELYLFSGIAVIIFILASLILRFMKKNYNLSSERQWLKAVETYFVILTFAVALYSIVLPTVVLIQTSSASIFIFACACGFLLILLYSLYNGLDLQAVILSIISMASSFAILLGSSYLIRLWIFDFETRKNRASWNLALMYNFIILMIFSLWGRRFRSVLPDYYARSLEASFFFQKPMSRTRALVVNAARAFNHLVGWIQIELPEFRYSQFQNPPPLSQDFTSNGLQKSTPIETLLLLKPKPILIMNAVIHDLYSIRKDHARLFLLDKAPNPYKEINPPGLKEPKFGHFIMATGKIEDGTKETRESPDSLDFVYFGAPDRLKRIKLPPIAMPDAMGVSGGAVGAVNGKFEDQARSRQMIALLFSGGLGTWVKYSSEEPTEWEYPPKSQRKITGLKEFEIAPMIKVRFDWMFGFKSSLAFFVEFLVAGALSLAGFCYGSYTQQAGVCDGQYTFEWLLGDSWVNGRPPVVIIIALLIFSLYMFSSSVPSKWLNIGFHSPFIRHLYQVFKVIYEGPTTHAPGDFIYLTDGGHLENLGAFQLFRQKCDLIIMCDANNDPEGKCEDLNYVLEWARKELNCSFAPSEEDERDGIHDLDKAIFEYTYSSHEERPFLKFRVYYPEPENKGGPKPFQGKEQVANFREGIVYYIKTFKLAQEVDKKELRALGSIDIPARDTSNKKNAKYSNPFLALIKMISGDFPMHNFFWQFFHPDDFLAYAALGYNYIIPVVRDIVDYQIWSPSGAAAAFVVRVAVDSKGKLRELVGPGSATSIRGSAELGPEELEMKKEADELRKPKFGSTGTIANL